MKTTALLPGVLGVLLWTGCSSTPPEMPKMKMTMGIPDGTVEYKPLSPAESSDLSFQMISKPTVCAGEKTALIFALSNDGNRSISIPEWYTWEQDNVVLFVQPWLTGMTEPHPESWIELSFDMKQPVMHYPVTLLPGNKVIVTKELPFIEKLQVSPGKARRYFVKAKLNLKSLPIESEVITLQVLSKNKTGEKQ